MNTFLWEDFNNSSYSTDIALADYNLFRSLHSYLTGKKSSLLKVFLTKVPTILSPRSRTSTKEELAGYLKDGNKP